MPRYVRHYDFDPATETIGCPKCGWEDAATEASIELYEGLCELECPKCSERLIVVVFPTPETTRAAAAAGNARAQEELAGLERREARRAKAQAVALTRPSQLPDAVGPVDVIWDFEEHGDECLTILRAGDQVLWGELAYWEGIERFKEVAAILRRRYGRELRSITPSPASTLFLYGDKLSAPQTVDRVNAELKRPPQSPG
jgi:DNA-directed RNA polymerase subunit RPC12/RpoP